MCSEFDYIYHGETVRNAYTRGNEHISALQKQYKNSLLLRHTTQDHSNNDFTCYVRVTGIPSRELNRHIKEEMTINNTPRDQLINNKAEYGHNKLVRAPLTAE